MEASEQTEAVVEARERLATMLTCSHCGLRLSMRACGPTHAALAASPDMHWAVGALFEEARTAARSQALEEVAARLKAIGDAYGNASLSRSVSAAHAMRLQSKSHGATRCLEAVLRMLRGDA